MNEDIKRKIKMISEMLYIYQTTVVKETENENINLIKKDVANKKNDLENIRNDLEKELNRLYDNGSNEIDPEVNQLQSVINEVEDLIDDVIPDILMYTKTSIQEKEANLNKLNVEREIEDQSKKDKTKEEFLGNLELQEKSITTNAKDDMNEKNDNKIEKKEIESNKKVEMLDADKNQGKMDKIAEKTKVQKESALKDVKSEEKDQKIEEQEIELNIKTERVDVEKTEEKSVKKMKVQMEPTVEKVEPKSQEKKNGEEIEEKIEFFDENDKKNEKKIKIDIDKESQNNGEVTKIILEELLEEDFNKRPIKTNIRELVKEHNNIINKEAAIIPKNANYIILKQPTEDYRNTATTIVFNRTKNVNSPENAIKKAYNASEVVMNNIIEKWNGNK